MGRKVKLVELGEICEFQRGMVVPAQQQMQDYETDEKLFPFIQIRNLKDTQINIEKISWFNPKGFAIKDSYFLYPNEIIVACIGSTAGKIAINQTNQNLCFSSNCSKLRIIDKSTVNQKYLFYSLLSKQEEICSKRKAGAKPFLEENQVKLLKIPLPPLEQQEKIAKWLETFSSLERQLERHKTQYRYYLNRLIRGGQLVELSSLCEFQRGLTISEKDQFKENIEGNLLPIIKIGNIQESRIVAENLCWLDPNQFQNIDQFYFLPGEILIANTGFTSGKVGCNNSNIKYVFYSGFLKLKPQTEIINQKYLLYSLLRNQEKINSFILMGVRPALDLHKVKKLKIVLPSLEQQEKIANWLDRFRELTENISRGLPREILLLKQQSRYYREKLIN